MLGYEFDRGYQRLAPPNVMQDDAVRWWYVRTTEDGFVFARGGNVATTRDARHIIASMEGAFQYEYTRWRKRPTQRLETDGSLTAIASPVRG